MHLYTVEKRYLQLARSEEEGGSGYSGELLGRKGSSREVAGGLGALVVVHSRLGRLRILLQMGVVTLQWMGLCWFCWVLLAHGRGQQRWQRLWQGMA